MNDLDIIMANERRRDLVEDIHRIKNAGILRDANRRTRMNILYDTIRRRTNSF